MPTNDKTSLRTHYRSLRKLPTTRNVFIVPKLETIPPRPQTLHTYLSLPGEIDTHPILSWAWDHDIQTFTSIPQPNGVLTHHPILPNTQLSCHAWGMMIPDTPATEIPDLDWIVVPGLAFDLSGTRLGFGGGYYDRFLATHPESHTIGLCFDSQLHPEPLPREPHDIPVDTIITETRVINAKTPPRR